MDIERVSKGKGDTRAAKVLLWFQCVPLKHACWKWNLKRQTLMVLGKELGLGNSWGCVFVLAFVTLSDKREWKENTGSISLYDAHGRVRMPLKALSVSQADTGAMLLEHPAFRAVISLSAFILLMNHPI